MTQTMTQRLEVKHDLPESHRPYTDKYFLRTNEILKAEGLNPYVSMKVFTRGEGEVAGLDEAVEVLRKYSDLEHTGEVWVTKQESYKTKEPLMVIRGPIQSFVELETMYLGVLSHALSEAAGFETPQPDAIQSKLERLAGIYGDIPITYFGARHYHWSLDKEIAAAALRGGASQTSTDIGSSNVGLEGVGTTPHVLTLVLAHYYGIENATLKTAELFDKHIAIEVPRMTLVDTFNRELTDSLAVARYYGDRKNFIRLDTCGENIGEGGTVYEGNNGRDPSYQKGTGVTVELARNLRQALIDNGYGDYTDVFLTSGFGDEEKAEVFVEANGKFREETGYNLFVGVGIGEASKARFGTADISEIEGKPFSKTGRENPNMDYSSMRREI